MTKKKKSFILHIDSLDIFEDLEDAQIGELMRAIRAYHTGEEMEISGLMKAIFRNFKNQFERDSESYEKVCVRNAKNGAKGGRPKQPKETQDNPKKPKETQRNPKQADNDSDNDNDSKNDNDIKKEKIYKKDFPENQEPELSEFKGTDTTVNTPEQPEDKTSAQKDEIIGSGVYPKKELNEYADYISQASTQLKDMWTKELQMQKIVVPLQSLQKAFLINLSLAAEYKKYNQASIQRYFFNWMKKNAYQYKPRQDSSKPTFTSFNKSNAR